MHRINIYSERKNRQLRLPLRRALGIQLINFREIYMINKIGIYSLIILLTGCAAHPSFNIKTTSPAYIEVDGEIVCETTPCKIVPPHYVRAFGECASGSSMKSLITAFPLDKSKGFVQQKVVSARCNDNKKLYFDMDVAGGVQTIQLTK
jgi:hypothetical protein